MYFTITGMKNIVQQQHYLTMTIPDLSLLFTFFSFVQKGEGEEGRESYKYSYLCPILSHPFGSVSHRLAVAFILTYSYLHTAAIV